MSEMMKLGGVACDALIKACGSPLYVYDEDAIDNQLSMYTTNFTSAQFNTDVIYASKAFTCTSMLSKIAAHECSLDVVSGGELYVAKRAQFPAERIYFHGNNKLEEEIVDALSYGVGTIVIDNMHEVDMVVRIAAKQRTKVDVLVRINPKVEAHTHEFIMTANGDSKFGISIDLKDDIKAMIATIGASEYARFQGFHSHIGSQIFEREAFVMAIDKMVAFLSIIKDEMNIDIPVLNIGGGFGVRYTEEDTPTPTPLLCQTLIQAIEDACDTYKVKLCKVCMEPGRSIVAEAGYTLYTVGFTKKTMTKHFAFIDGGMADNIRPALYDAKYACDVANKMDKEKSEMYEIAGKCCESGDIIIHDASLPLVETGDILVVYTTGAYGYTMSSNYNRLNRPASVFVKNGQAKVVIRRETYQDQLICDHEEVVIK